MRLKNETYRTLSAWSMDLRKIFVVELDHDLVIHQLTNATYLIKRFVQNFCIIPDP